MARDSSPFAQRLKALAGRSGRHVGDASDASAAQRPVGDHPADASAAPTEPAASDATASETPQATPTAPEPSSDAGPEPSSAAAAPEPLPDAATPPDEQPTGEFPALSNEQPTTQTPALSDDQPTTQTPALSDDQLTQTPAVAPIWLDPPQYDATPAAAAPSGSVDWAPPADDVIEPPTQPSDSSVEPSPYLGGEFQANTPSPAETPAWQAPFEPQPELGIAPPAPIWESEAQHASDAPSAANQPPIWAPLSPTDPTPPAAPFPAATGDDTTPAWVAEAEAIGEPTGAIVPPPRATGDTSFPAPGASVPDAGPTLSPPVLPKKAQPADSPSDQSPESLDAEPTSHEHQTASGSLGDAAAPQDAAAPESASTGIPTSIPDESEPEWTPTALHEALTLPGDEPDEAAAEDQASPVSETPPPAERDDQPTQVSAAVPESSGRRSWRPAFGKRKASSEPDAADQAVDQPSSDARSEAPSGLTDVEGPAAAETPADEPAAAAASDDEKIELVKSDAGSPASATPAAETDDSTTAPRDPGSITSRLAIVGRRAKSLTGRKSAEPTDDSAVESTTFPAPAAEQEPAARPSSSAPVVIPAPAIKPSFAERSALRRRVKSLRARRDAGLAELGAIVLDQSRFGDPTGGTLVRRRTALLADLDSEIAAIESALEDERTVEAVAQLGVVHCTSCSALIGPADRFCAHCGTARPSAHADASSAADAS